MEVEIFATVAVLAFIVLSVLVYAGHEFRRLTSVVGRLESDIGLMRGDLKLEYFHGIEEILIHISNALQAANAHGRVCKGLWFLGVTLGIGTPHRHRSRGGVPIQEYIFNRTGQKYEDFCDALRTGIGKFRAGDRVIVCLDPGELLEQFVQHLGERSQATPTIQYKALNLPESKALCKDIERDHNRVLEDLGEGEHRLFVARIPFQVLVVMWEEVGTEKSGQACVVFFIESGGAVKTESGFYSESKSVCRAFQNIVDHIRDTEAYDESRGARRQP